MTVPDTTARFVHTGLSVADLERSLQWYGLHFGATATKRFEKPDLEIRGAVIAFEGGNVELLEVRRPRKLDRATGSLVEELRTIGTNHVALGVADCGGCRERLVQSGCEMVTPLLGGTMFFCKDPDGTLLEVKQV